MYGRMDKEWRGGERNTSAYKENEGKGERREAEKEEGQRSRQKRGNSELLGGLEKQESVLPNFS